MATAILIFAVLAALGGWIWFAWNYPVMAWIVYLISCLTD